MMARKPDLLGAGRTKLQPKLQMIANGSGEVNAVRAEQCAALRISSPKLLKTLRRRSAREDRAVTRRRVRRVPARGSLKTISSGVEVNVFVQLREGDGLPGPLRGEVARKGNVVSARVPLNALPALARDPEVAFVEIGEALKKPQPVLSTGPIAAPAAAERRFGAESAHGFGEDVLIGIVDVQGFDFSHPDFLDSAGRTRFVNIWDQGGSSRPGPGGPRFDYGSEIRKEHLQAALSAAPHAGVPAYELEPQSQMAEGSHGTHVASIAAGNRGVCRKAPIAGVLISLPEADEDRRKSFYDSTRIADAVDYLVALAATMKKRVSINISLGTNGHAHDG